jgi:type II secretory pathway component PulF
MLAEPARMARNTWLVPLGIMLFGSAVCIVARLFRAPLSATIGYALETAEFYAVVAVVVVIVPRVPALDMVVAQLRLALPLIGPAERELAVNRFCHAMNMLYSTGGMRVEQMIRWAAASAGNVALTADFLRAARVVEGGGTISEAFSAIAALSPQYRATILAGDEAGKLDAAFDTVCRQTADAANGLLTAFQAVFFRVVALAVIASIAMTLKSLM